jgi:hypothetical protein
MAISTDTTAPVRLPLPRNRDEFNITADPAGSGNVLVVPTKTKHRWKSSELWYRSAVLSPEGEVMSMGLPKFRNVGEDERESADFASRLEQGEPVVFTEKMDGSLAIRSVIDGQVIWRTRGSWDGGPEYGPAIRELAAGHPVLADAAFMPDHSLHFEFVHPSFPVVIRYERPQLVLLSGVRHHDLHLLMLSELQRIAGEHDLVLAPIHELPTDMAQLRAAVEAWEGCEGIVARYDHEQHYVKLKGMEYLRQHRLRFSFGLRETLRHCYLHDFDSEQAFADYLHSLEMDWEVIQTRLPIWRVYELGRERLRADIAEVRSFIDAYGSLVVAERHAERTRAHARLDDRAARKEYARLVREAYADSPSIAAGCFSMTGQDGGAEWRRKLLERHVEDALRDSRLPADEDEV